MSAFTGPQGKGASRRHREQKRVEAVARSLVTPHERMRAHRLGRCNFGRGCPHAS